MTFVNHGVQYGILAFLFTSNPWIIALAIFTGIFPDIPKLFQGKLKTKYEGLHHKLHQFKWYNALFFIHTLEDYFLYDHKAGEWKWWAYHVEVYSWLIIIMWLLNPHPVIVILGLYLASVAFDVQKCIDIEKYGWKNVNPKYHHENGWHFKTIAVWFIPLLVLSFIDPVYLMGFIIFWIEDLLYYVFKYIVYKKWLPKELPWLTELKFWKVDLVLPFKMTKNLFLVLVSSQILIFNILWFFVI